MKKLFENFRRYLNESAEPDHLSDKAELAIHPHSDVATAKSKPISYSGVVLDDESRKKLLSLGIPEGWEPVAHHMTITMGALVHKKGKHDFSETYPVGSEIELPVIAIGQDDRAMAAKVEAPSPIKTKSWPHVTVAVNRAGGGKPFHSNKIPEENFQPLSGVVLRGAVQEIPQ